MHSLRFASSVFIRKKNTDAFIWACSYDQLHFTYYILIHTNLLAIIQRICFTWTNETNWYCSIRTRTPSATERIYYTRGRTGSCKQNPFSSVPAQCWLISVSSLCPNLVHTQYQLSTSSLQTTFKQDPNNRPALPLPSSPPLYSQGACIHGHEH